MVMGACPGQIPISCVPLTLMVTATVVRACRYIIDNGSPVTLIPQCLPNFPSRVDRKNINYIDVNDNEIDFTRETAVKTNNGALQVSFTADHRSKRPINNGAT